MVDMFKKTTTTTTTTKRNITNDVNILTTNVSLHVCFVEEGKMLRYVLDLVSQGLLDVSIASAVGQRIQVENRHGA